MATTDKKSALKITLPLSVVGFGDIHAALRTKFFLIRKFKFDESGDLLRIFRIRTKNGKVSAEDRGLLDRLWKNVELDDLDLAELFVCHLPQIIEQQDEKFLASLDPRPTLHRKMLGDHYGAFVKTEVVRTAARVKRFTLPRVRAKLAVRELICLITSDTKHLTGLILTSPRYLACPATTDIISRLRSGRVNSDPKIRGKAENDLASLSQAILGTPRKQPRRYGYWQVDYFFNEVLACIQKLDETQTLTARRDYIRAIDQTWKLPENYPEILAKKVSSPVETTLAIMVEKEMIVDPSTYRNVISPHTKKLRKRYPYLRACDPLVERLLDLPTKKPDTFSNVDLWKQLESFQFDLTAKELQVGHSITHPDTVVRV